MLIIFRTSTTRYAQRVYTLNSINDKFLYAIFQEFYSKAAHSNTPKSATSVLIFENRKRNKPERKMPQGFPRPSHAAPYSRTALDRLRDKPALGKEIRNHVRPQHHQQQTSLFRKERMDKRRKEQTRQSLQPHRKRTRKNKQHAKRNRRNPRIHKNHPRQLTVNL